MTDELWRIKIELTGNTIHDLRCQAATALKCIENAHDVRELWIGGGGGGWNEIGGSFSVIREAPIADRIKSLREQADTLEARLKPTAREHDPTSVQVCEREHLFVSTLPPLLT
jgi:hypothetical protein